MLITKAAYVDVTETEGARVYTFRASTSAVDRQNEIIDQAGWDLESYRSNPVVLDSHKYDSIHDVIGKAVRVEVINGALEVDLIFANEDCEELVSKGFLRTVSVGFRSLARRPGAGAGAPMTHTRMELLEVSLVAIPANREAVRLRSLEDDMSTETKAGRRLSKSSAETIMQAISLLQSLLEDMPAAPETTADMPMMEDEACKPKPKGINLDSGTVAALAAFAREAKTNG